MVDVRDRARWTRSGPISAYVQQLGVPPLPARTVPFDPGYDALTVLAHLDQSSHLMGGLKLSMACWQIASETEVQRKVDAARSAGVPLVAGGASFEIASHHGLLHEYLQMCAALGMTRVEAGEGFTDLAVHPRQAVAAAASFGLEVQFELGRKHEGTFDERRADQLVDQGQEWLAAGAVGLVVEARESAQSIGLFSADGALQGRIADRLATALTLDLLCFEAPAKASQFALLDHFGPEVWLSNVRLEELLRVEIYRRGLHADAYGHPLLCPWVGQTDLARA